MIIVYAYSDQIDDVQRGFGIAVLLGEGIYLVGLCVATMISPAFLLFAPSRSAWRALLMYVLAPTTFVWLIVFYRLEFESGSREGCFSRFLSCLTAMIAPDALFPDDCSCCSLFWILPCLELCGAVALIIGVCKQNLAAPLAIGYLVSFLGIVWLVLNFVHICCRCGERFLNPDYTP